MADGRSGPGARGGFGGFGVGVGARTTRTARRSVDECALEEASRKKRCADRSDSSESSDSGVAALSCTDCSSSGSGSDITEPGSPASSSSSGSASAATPSTEWRSWTSPLGKRPRTADDSLDSLVSAKLLENGVSPDYDDDDDDSPPTARRRSFDMPSEKIEKESRVLPQALADRCVSQIASIPKHIIHKAMPQQCSGKAVPISESNAEAKRRQPSVVDKIQQGRITEYFKSQMKPTDGLKRDIDAWMDRAKAPDERDERPTRPPQSLNPRVLLDQPKVARKSAPIVPKSPAEFAKIASQSEKMPLPRLASAPTNCRLDVNGPQKKTDFNKTSTDGVHARGPVKAIKKMRAADRRKPIAPKTDRKMQHKKDDADGNCKFPAGNLDGGTMLNSNNANAPHANVIPDHLRQLLIKVRSPESRLQAHESKPTATKGDQSSEQVPSLNHPSQLHNSNGIKTPHRTDAVIGLPVSAGKVNPPVQTVPMSPTVMLATIRVPEHGMQPPPRSETSSTTASHISIASQANINNQFMLPVVQNINGTILQIPGLMTKVGQNAMMPLQNQSLMAQAPNNGLNHSHPQMFINGTLLKLNGHVHPNMPTLTKQLTANNLTNVSYAVTPKNIPSVPTAIGSKPNYTMNLNHPIFVSSPGFILNSMGSVVTTQTSTGIAHVQQAFTAGNVMLTAPVHHGVHLAPHIGNAIPNMTLQPNNISLPPLKLDGINHLFITSQTQQQIFHSQEKKEEITNRQCMTTSVHITEQSNLLNTEISMSNSLTNHSVPVLNSIVDRIISKSIDIAIQNDSKVTNENKLESNTIKESNVPPILIQSKNSTLPSNDLDLESNKVDNSFMNVSDETKSSMDSMSIDLNRTNDTPSIDSPDTEISKELDEDSLNISINTSIGLSSTQTNSMLTQPKTIRFPVKKYQQSETKSRPVRTSISEVKLCQWKECRLSFEDGSDLLEHLQECHVSVQADKETYSCLWQGCKVYNRPSCSRSWLERHVLSHGGSKVFRCIVDGCGQRFNTHLALQKHVNNHFTESESNVSSTKKTVDNNGGPKLIRRNGKKLRYRRQPWSARMFDYFDSGIMEGLQYRVVQAAIWRSGAVSRSTPEALYSCERNPHCITMVAKAIARRINADSLLPEYLVQWTPPNVLEDEWLLEKDIVPIKEVPITSLNAETRGALYTSFCDSYRSPPSKASQSIRIRTFSVPFKESFVKPSNGFCKPINGKILDAQNSHNNKSKTDRFNTCVTNESKCVLNSECEDVRKITGAARRKQRRRRC